LEEEKQHAFDKIKAAAANTIRCTYLKPTKCFIIPDPSQKYAMGAMLVQEIDSVKHIISILSRKFNNALLK
jgi:hypothetical protein